MDSHNLASLAEKTKKPSQLKSLLYAKIVDKTKLIEYFLENHTCIPQEHRLTFWKVMFDVWSIYPSQYQTIDLILKNHHEYLKHTIKDVLKISHNNEAQLNYCIYLLDRDLLPLNESDIFKNSKSHSFCLLYKQISDILDDAAEFELYYLITKFYEHLKENLKSMQEKFYAHFQKDPATKALTQQINIDQMFLTALSNVFKDITVYHVMLDHLVVGDFDLLIYTMISIFENLREEHLKHFLLNQNNLSNDLLQKLGQDESKIIRTSHKYYKNKSTSQQQQQQQQQASK